LRNERRKVWIEIDVKESEVVTDYIDQTCRKEGEKERNDGSFIGKEETAKK